MRSDTFIMLLLAAVPSMAGLAGCEEPGPLEKAGKKADEALEDASDKTEELMEKAKDEVQKATED